MKKKKPNMTEPLFVIGSETRKHFFILDGLNMKRLYFHMWFITMVSQ